MYMVILQLSSIAFQIPFLIIIGVAALGIVSSVEIVDAYEKKAYTVLGEYRGLLGPGYHFIYPFVSSTSAFDTRTQTIDVKKQKAITKDNSPVNADAVVYIKVMDAKRAFLNVDEYKTATASLAQTTLRAVLGDMELDETLKNRQQINKRIQDELDEPTDEWGVSVESVEVREVTPSKDVQESMEKQTSAERNRRAMILEAEGERQSSVEEAEGERKADVIRARGKKQSQVLEAQGDAISTVLRAKAAKSMGEQAVIERGMEALETLGEGDSTKFVIPQEVSSLLGRYGANLSGSDVADNPGLDSEEFDAETEELLGLDEIDKVIDEVDVEEEVDDVDNVDIDEADIDAQVEEDVGS